MPRAVLAALCTAVACAAPVSAAPRASGWVAKANAACEASNAKVLAAFGGHPTVPSTRASMFRFMVEIRPLEVGRLKALRAIPSPPAGAAKAFALAQADIAELDAAVSAYRDGNSGAFGREATTWWNDRRASRAFAALGARSCT